MAFECGVCTSMYNTGSRIPLLLECGHTFCQSCVQHNLGAQRCCPYCRHPILKHVDDLPRNYALENAMEAANLPLVELMDRWGLANAERMMVKPDHLTLGSLISRKGYTGEVWKGTLWGKPVAVKLLPLLDVDERQVECLRREVAVLLHTTGECKQVCIYKGFCVKNGNFAIIMKLYSYSLAHRVSIAPGRRLPLPLALKYSMDIVKGLVELHRLGVIAADLKPDNVLIDEELGDAIIADFGISSVVTTTIGNTTGRGSAVRSSGAMRGTPNYMSPEQFAPGSRTSNKVDVWGFAATLLHMITGSPPWQHDTLMQICTAVGVAKQAPPLPEGLPQPLQALMSSCFEADPAKRPTAVYLLKALQALGPVLQQHLLAGAVSSAAPLQQQQQQQHIQQQGHPPTAHAAAKAPAAAVQDEQAGLRQYLAQLGLSDYHSRLQSVSSGGGGMPSAPPLPGNSSGSILGGSNACLGRRSSSNGGGSNQKLPRVLWSEEEAFREHQTAQQQHPQPQQQHRQLQSAVDPVGLSGMQGAPVQQQQQQKPHWAPHHVRSASEQVSGLSSRAYQQQQLQQQQLHPHEVAGGGPWQQQQQQQQQQQAHHARSRSEVVPGWGAGAADAAGTTAGYLSSRGPRAADGSILPTHYESGLCSSAEPGMDTAAAAAAAAAAAGGSLGQKQEVPGQVKRQRQQWQIPAQQQQQVAQQDVPACAAAADYAASYGKMPAGGLSAAGSDCKPGMAPCQDPQPHWQSQGKQQQQHAVGDATDATAGTQQQQPWWETPFDANSCRSPSPEAAHSKAPLPTTTALQEATHLDQQYPDQGAAAAAAAAGGTAAAAGVKKGVPSPLVLHAHADCSSAAVQPIEVHPVSNRYAGSSNSSTASLSRAGSCDNSFTGRGEAGACPSICSRSGSARRPPRTLSDLLLGRANSRAAMPTDLRAGESQTTSSNGSVAAVAAGSSSGSPRGDKQGSYTAGLTKIRMAFGPASPERVPRAGAFASTGSILSGAAVPSAAVASTGAGVAALCVGGAAGAAGASAGAVALAGTAAGAGASAAAGATAAVAAGAAGSTGMVAAMASRWGRGSRSASDKMGHVQGSTTDQVVTVPAGVACHSAPASPGCAAAATHAAGPSSSSSSAEKPSRWRALFGSPSRRRPSPQVTAADRSGPCGSARRCSVLDVTGVQATGGSSTCEGPGSSSSSPAGYMRQDPAEIPHLPLASPLAALPLGLVPNSPGGISVSRAAVSSDLHQQQQPPLTPQSAAAHAANIAAAEAARASGTCSPLKAHARNLSLPSKLMVLSSTDPSPASSPNPVAASPVHANRQQQDAAAAAAAGRAGSPSKLRPSGSMLGCSSRSSSGNGTAPGTPVEAAATSGSSSGGSGSSTASHSQLLAEAVQLEVLARSLSQQGRLEEAEAALRNSLAMITKQLGPGHPNTVAATTRLALHLNNANKHTEAERLLRQVLTHKQAMLGRKHPQVAAASINLAACLYSQGHYNAAARLYSTALETRKAALGDTHADTAACLNNLALCYSRLSDWQQAEQLFREALSARVAALGQLHPDVAITAHQLGHCLGQLGQHSEALVYHKQGLWVRQQQEHRGPQDAGASSSSADGSGPGRGSSSGGSSGKPAEDLVASHRCVALCLARLGCDAQAQEHLTHVLLVRDSQVTTLTPPPPPGSSGTAHGGGGGTLGGRSSHRSRTPTGSNGKLGALDDVDWSVLADGDSRLSKAQADGLLALAAAAEELGRCLSRQGKHAEAEEQYWRSLEARSQVLGSQHELVMGTEEQLRKCLEQQC